MSDAARARAQLLLPRNGKTLLVDDIYGQRRSYLMDEWHDELAAALDAYAAEQTAALRAQLSRYRDYVQSLVDEVDRLPNGYLLSGYGRSQVERARALLADAGQAGACDWKIERCPICRHDAPHVGCVTAVLETLAAERARQR